MDLLAELALWLGRQFFDADTGSAKAGALLLTLGIVLLLLFTGAWVVFF
jgi:hypothetical protein